MGCSLRGLRVFLLAFSAALAALVAGPAADAAAATAASAASNAETPTWGGGGPVGGNVYAIVSDPSRSGALYAATQRGVFASADGGASWSFVWSGLPATRVQALAIVPGSPATLFAGTLTPTGVPSVGIFRSTDSGATWTASDDGIIDTSTGVSPVDVESIAVDPRNPNVVLAGSLFSDIFRSADGGSTWQPVTLGGFSLGLQTSTIVFDPSNSSNVYAASNLGFLRSTDGGNTWFLAGDAGVPFFSLAIDPSQPRTLYAGDSTGSGIWKSTDGGSHWATANVSFPGTSNARPPVIALAVDPVHPATIFAATYGNGVWVSRNGAASWSSAGTGMRDTRVAAIALVGGGSSILYAGTYGGGVYTSADSAQTWARSNAGLRAAVVSALLVDPVSPGTIYAATSDAVYATDDGGGTWRESDSGIAPYAVAALAASPGASPKLFAGTLGSGLYQSTDRGATWTSAAASRPNDSYISSIAVDPTAAATVYAGTAHPYTGSNPERVFKSADGGSTWTQTSLDAGQFSIDFIAVNPSRASEVFAGSSGAGGLYRSQDGGTSWSPVATDAACGGLKSVVFPPSGSPMYLAGTGGVCRSTDGGTTWSVASAGGREVDSVLVDPAAPTTLYAGTAPDLLTGSGGVFVSTDGGVSFSELGEGLPSVAVNALALQPASGVLYAGTNGAGVATLAPVAERGTPVVVTRPRTPRPVDPR